MRNSAPDHLPRRLVPLLLVGLVLAGFPPGTTGALAQPLPTDGDGASAVSSDIAASFNPGETPGISATAMDGEGAGERGEAEGEKDTVIVDEDSDSEEESAEELARAEYEAAVQEFRREADEFRRDIGGVIQRRISAERRRIRRSYEAALDKVEAQERQDRNTAIALFERFVERYPDDEKTTPDAMTRLAELYYERAIDNQNQALARHDFDARDESGGEAHNEWGGDVSFARSIGLYEEIIARFPDYRLLDTVHYLLGYCLERQGEPERARDAYSTLIARFPQSQHVPEAWVRIGEYWFDSAGDDPRVALRNAAHAYTEATRFEDGPLFDKALYKLGWTWYRLDDFDRAVASFVQLIDFYDSRREQALAKGGVVEGGDLRVEALQYTANSFADERWGGVGRMERYFQRLGGRPWEHELYRLLGDALYELTRYDEAIHAYRLVLRKQPLLPDAPGVHDRIVQSHARLQQRDRAFAERGVLVSLYSVGSEWAQANADNPEALKEARDLVERSLLATAQYHHAQAREWEDTANSDDARPRERSRAASLALRSYRAAAQAYGSYLEQYPRSQRLYEVTYLHAETLFHSEQFVEAAGAYTRVRDSNADARWMVAAAYQVVVSLEREIERQERSGQLIRREPCTAQSCKGRALDAVPIPELRLRLVEAADAFLRKIPDHEDAPLLAYRAAQVFFAHFHFDEAFARYERIIERHPEHEVALYAFEDMLNRHLLAEDWLAVELLADRVLRESGAVQEDRELFEEKRLVKYFARFNRAEQARAQERWDEAAALYLDLVDEVEGEAERWGPWENVDAALFNAASSFVAGRRFDSAMRTYERLFTDYPRSPLAQGALFEVAFNAEKAFDFEKAVTGYLRLVDEYPEAKQRSAALFNAAKLLEALQRPEEAAQAYRRYSELFPDESDAAEQAFQAALVHERSGNYRAMLDGLAHYLRRFGNEPSETQRVILAHLKIGHARRELGDSRRASQAFQTAVAEFDRRGLGPDDHVAARAAAEARFWLAEEEFETFSAIRFAPRGRGAALTRSMTTQLENLATALENVKQSYTEVIVKYRWPEWMMAALYRLGFADESFANRLLESPCPPDIRALGGEEACIEYRIQLEELMMPVLDRAVLAYETAADRAAELRIANSWTRLTMEKVCQSIPAKCRSLKEPRARFVMDAMGPLSFATRLDGSFEPRPNLPPLPSWDEDGDGEEEEESPESPGAPSPQTPTPAPLPGIGTPSDILAPVSDAMDVDPHPASAPAAALAPLGEVP